MARVVRNRESAQLSRQRRKHHVVGLEEKVRSMGSLIAELSGKVSFFVAENASLRQQLGGFPAMGPAAHYLWVPPGSQVPLVPIPRWKPAAAAPTGKKKGGRTKKLASVSLLGLLFLFMLVLGAFVPGFNGGNRKGGILGRIPGRVLVVSDGNGVDRVKGSGELNSGEVGERVSRHLPGSCMYLCTGNGSEPLVASLYVPRNNQLVKIDGNLVLSSVLAGERAATHTSVDRSNDAASTAGHPHMYGSVANHQRAFSSGTDAKHGDSVKWTHSDGSPQEGFTEGLQERIFSSGMCTEVFQFEASQTSGKPGSIIPATPVANAGYNRTRKSVRHRNAENRRFLRSQPIPLAGSTESNTSKGFTEAPENSNLNSIGGKSSSPMIVSVLVDPRDVDDVGDGTIFPKSISRIFVVVLLDSVKYVTYSCVLPLRSNVPHLVTK